MRMQSSTFNAMVMLQLQVLLLMGVGFVLTKIGTITGEGRKSLSDILINFILPCNIICSFQMDLTADLIVSCGLVLLLALAAQVLFYVVGHFCYPGQRAERLSCLRYATLCPNAGFLGLPIIGGVFGEIGSLLTSIALLPQRVVMWSAGVSLFTKADSKSVVKKVLTHPCIIAVAIGFALLLTGNPTLPAFLQKTVSSAGGCTTCVSMLVIGSILAGAKAEGFKDRMILWFTFLRLIAIPLIAFLPLRLLGVDPVVTGVVVLISGMPAGSTTAILASKYDGDAEFASCMVFVSTLASIVTLPVLCLFL